MNDSWNKAVASYVPGPKRDYWTRVIHLLLDEGAVPLPSSANAQSLGWTTHDVIDFMKVETKLEELRKICSDLDLCMEEFIEDEVRDGRHNFGWLVFENHDRTMPINDFIERVLPGKLRFSNYWLLPVFDDEEWISWTFIFVPMDAERLLEGIEALKQTVLTIK